VRAAAQNTSGEVKLENGPDNFARNRTDVFNVDLLPLGDISQLRIGHDGKGNNPRVRAGLHASAWEHSISAASGQPRSKVRNPCA
jgi:hypothetical protein